MNGSKGIWKNTFALTLVGGLAFWLANFAISRTAIAAEYRAALSISYAPMLLEALIGGLLIALFISFFLLRFSDRIPGRKPIVKVLILSLLIIVTIEVLSALANPAHASIYLLRGTELNAPRFLALGLAMSYLYDKQKGKI